MSTISIQVLQAGAVLTTVRASTLVVVTDSAAAVQNFTLTGTESPVGFIPSVTVAAGSGTVLITDQDASNNPIGTPVSVPYTTSAATPQLASSGATITVLTP
jgi:hypothetical protein